MGIEAEFKQVSPYLLEKLKEYPDFVELFFDSRYLPDSPFWQEFTYDLEDPNDEELSNLASEALEKLKQNKREEYETLKNDIPLIIEEGKAEYLDIDKTWYWIHFLLTGYDYSVRPSFIIGENEEDNLPSINAVLGGKEIDYAQTYGLVRYFTAEEVKQIAEALTHFSCEMVKERIRLQGRKEEDFNELFDYTYNPFIKYYQEAGEKGNAMFLYLC